MHYFSVNTITASQIINCFKAFKTYCKIEIAAFNHLLTQLFIHKSTVCICKKCTITMFFTQFYNIFLAYKRFSTCKHIKIYTKFFSLSYNTIHLIECKIKFIAVLCRPASCTMQITCTCRIHKNKPWHITVMYFSHLSYSLSSMEKCFVTKIKCRCLQDMRINFIEKSVNIFI